MNDNDNAQQIEQLTKRYNQILKLVVQLIDQPNNNSNIQTRRDLVEALDIAQQVITERLRFNPNEWKNDKKQHYKALFMSIEQEVQESIRLTFSSPSQQYVGFILNKFLQLAIEPMVEVIQKHGISVAQQTTDSVFANAKQHVFDIPEVNDTDQGMIAKTTLDSFSQKRLYTQKKLSKQQRYDMIARVAERVQKENS